MLSITAPLKLVLTLQSVPPFLFESVLALALVLLLAIPLIARINFFLEKQNSYTSLIAANYPHQFVQKFDNNGCRIIRHQQFIPINSRISVNQVDTILPIAPINPNLTTTEHTKDLVDRTLLVSNYDYDFYRNKLIEENLKKQYGNQQAPGNVVLNSLHLNTIDSKTGLKLGDKYNHGLFDFIEEFHNSPRKSQIKIEYFDPLNHFLRKHNEKPHTTECSTETNDLFTKIDQVKEIVNFTGTTKVVPGARERIKLLAESGQKEKSNSFRHVKPPRTPNKKQLLENTSRPSSATTKDLEKSPKILKTPRKKITKNNEKLKEESLLKRPNTPAASDITKEKITKKENNSLLKESDTQASEIPKEKIKKKEKRENNSLLKPPGTPVLGITNVKLRKKEKKENDNSFHSKLPKMIEKFTTTCSSDASSEIFITKEKLSKKEKKNNDSLLKQPVTPSSEISKKKIDSPIKQPSTPTSEISNDLSDALSEIFITKEKLTKKKKKDNDSLLKQPGTPSSEISKDTIMKKENDSPLKPPGTPILGITNEKIIKKEKKENDHSFHSKLPMLNDKYTTSCSSDISSEIFIPKEKTKKDKRENYSLLKKPSTPSSEISKERVTKKDKKENDSSFHSKLPMMSDKFTTSCSSDISSEVYSSYSSSSRPTSSCGVASKTMKTLKSKIISRSKPSDNFDWEVPDVNGANYFEDEKELTKTEDDVEGNESNCTIIENFQHSDEPSDETQS